MYFGLNWTQAKQNKEQERDGEWSRRVPFPCNGKMAFHPLQLYFCPFLLAQTTISGPIGRWRSKRVKNGNFEFGFRKAREKKNRNSFVVRIWSPTHIGWVSFSASSPLWSTESVMFPKKMSTFPSQLRELLRFGCGIYWNWVIVPRRSFLLHCICDWENCVN